MIEHFLVKSFIYDFPLKIFVVLIIREIQGIYLFK